MKLFQPKFFGLAAAILLVIQLLAAWTPAAAVPIHDSVQAHPSVSFVHDGATARSGSKIDRFAFQQAVRKLWEDHVAWTRVYIISVLAGLPDTDAAAQRLLHNQQEIGDAIKPFYGAQAGDQLTSLLREHILIAADVLVAAKTGDNAGFKDANRRWHDNANKIADFLSRANPRNWPLGDMQSMMKTYLDLTLAEASARLNGDWAGDVVAYDKVHDEILAMADMLAAGVLKQFPGKFN